jgi:hypothetical protein
MKAPASPIRVGGSLTAFLVAATVLLAAAAVTYFMQGGPSGPAASTAPIDALYGLAVDAEGAVTGNEAALASFQSQLQQLKDAAAASPSAPFARDARFSRLMSDAATLATQHARPATWCPA